MQKYALFPDFSALRKNFVVTSTETAIIKGKSKGNLHYFQYLCPKMSE